MTRQEAESFLREAVEKLGIFDPRAVVVTYVETNPPPDEIDEANIAPLIIPAS